VIGEDKEGRERGETNVCDVGRSVVSFLKLGELFGREQVAIRNYQDRRK